MIKKISIKGFRGFGDAQTISFALPNKTLGSGITLLVGANNCGKTSIIEAIRCFNGHESPSFSIGKRNAFAGDSVEIILYKEDDSTVKIETVEAGGSSTNKLGNSSENNYVLQSRRFVEYEFGKGLDSRDNYIANYNRIDSKRQSQLSTFYIRLFHKAGGACHF